jgi:hypothetical protein
MMVSRSSIMNTRTIISSVTLLGLILFWGCRPAVPSPPGNTTFGDGQEIMQEVLDEALKGYRVQFGNVNWSGSGGTGEFSVHDTVIVQKADLKTVGDLIMLELQKLPKKRGWKSHGSGRFGDYYLSQEYQEGGARYYFDIILVQDGQDVRVMILHKGFE